VATMAGCRAPGGRSDPRVVFAALSDSQVGANAVPRDLRGTLSIATPPASVAVEQPAVATFSVVRSEHHCHGLRVPMAEER